MADSKEIVQGLLNEQNVSFPVLIPNMKGKIFLIFDFEYHTICQDSIISMR